MKTEKNSNRQLVKIVSEICEENNILIRKYSSDWILELDINKKIFYIMGYQFPNNNATTQALCEDKCALYEAVSGHCFAAVEHWFFMSPGNFHYIGATGNWEKLQLLLKKHKSLVIKSNTGSGGNNCFLVHNNEQLEKAVHDLFKTHRAIAVSPYYHIENEYRVIVLNGNVELMYLKERAFVIGDGINSLGNLIKLKFKNKEIEIDSSLDLFVVPKNNEVVTLTWKHNLGKGATATEIFDKDLSEKLSKLALDVANTIGINFASVDIISSSNELRILEINSGVMMEEYSRQSKETYINAKNIYKKAIETLYEGKRRKIKGHTTLAQPLVLPLLNKAAKEMGAQISMDEEFSNYCIYTFNNKKSFVARDLPFNINPSGSVALTTNKAATKYFLNKMGYSCPKTELIICKDYNKTYDELLQKSRAFNYPFILKPNNLSQGQLVFKIDNENELQTAFEQLYAKCNIFLLQEYCTGKDYRVVVLGDKIIQAYQRIPFCLIGDGITSIGDMLKAKKVLYEQQGRDTKLDIQDKRIFKALSKKNYTLETVLQNGEELYLQDISNLSIGGTSIDVLNQISPFFYKLCVDISNKLNMSLCGIDLFCDDISFGDNSFSEIKYQIIEVNSGPGLDNYLYNNISVEKQQEYVQQLYAEILSYVSQLK